MDDINEVWEEIPEFPRYAISNYGNVMNIRTEKLVKPQVNPKTGVVYVPLYENGDSSTRSVKVLVARAFVEGESKIFNTPINKDGDRLNNRADNILWRPLWFAVKFSRQFHDENTRSDVGPVFDTADEVRYETIFDVATKFGLLFRDVYRSSYSQTPVFPTEQVFSIPNPIHVR